MQEAIRSQLLAPQHCADGLLFLSWIFDLIEVLLPSVAHQFAKNSNSPRKIKPKNETHKIYSKWSDDYETKKNALNCTNYRIKRDGEINITDKTSQKKTQTKRPKISNWKK